MAQIPSEVDASGTGFPRFENSTVSEKKSWLNNSYRRNNPASSSSLVSSQTSEEVVLEDELYVNDKDVMFKEFFKLLAPESEYDKLSLLACNRAGIDVQELLYIPESRFRSQSKSGTEAKLEFTNYEERRKRRFRIVEAERAKLVEKLYIQATSPHGGTASCSELFSPPSTLGGGSDDSSSRHTKSIRNDLEVLRRREMRLIERELQLTEENEKLNQEMERREEQRALNTQLYHKLKRIENAMKEKLAQRRIMKQRASNEATAEEKLKKLTDRERKQKQKEINRALEMERKSAERAEELSGKIAQAKARREAVYKERDLHIELQYQEMTQKQHIFEERRTNIQLQKELALEVQQIKELTKQCLLDEFFETRGKDEEQNKHRILSKYNNIDDRLNRINEERDHYFTMRKNVAESRAQQRLLKKQQREKDIEEKAKKIFESEERHDNTVSARRSEKSVLHSLDNIKKRLIQENFLDNKLRLERQDEYRQGVKKFKMDNDIKRTEEFIRDKEREVWECKERARKSQTQRHKMMMEIEAMRSSSNPKKILKMAKDIRSQESRNSSPASKSSVQYQRLNEFDPFTVHAEFNGIDIEIRPSNDESILPSSSIPRPLSPMAAPSEPPKGDQRPVLRSSFPRVTSDRSVIRDFLDSSPYHAGSLAQSARFPEGGLDGVRKLSDLKAPKVTALYLSPAPRKNYCFYMQNTM